MNVVAAPLGSWEAFQQRLRRCTPPQRPPADIAATVGDVLAARAGRVLLLGMTPELTSVGAFQVAVDWSANALALLPSDGSRPPRGVQANWLHLPFADCSFSSIIGDGALNCLEYPHEYCILFDELLRLIRPHGRAVLRLFVTPDDCEPLAETQAAALSGRIQTVSGLKWRLAASLRSDGCGVNVPVRGIHQAFERLLPDRAALARATRWPVEVIDTIDALGGVAGTYSFPTTCEALAVVPDQFSASFVSSGAYEMAERCPLLVLERRA